MDFSQLYQSVKSHGWEKGKQHFIQNSENVASLLSYIVHVRHVAWKYFLPRKESGSICVFDCFLGTATIALTELYEKVFCIHHDFNQLSIIKKRVEGQRIKKVYFIHAQLGDLPFQDNCFDLSILPLAIQFDQFRHARLEKIILENHRILDKNGQIILLLANVYDFRLLLGHSSPPSLGVAANYFSVKKAIRVSGFSLSGAFALLPNLKKVNDIMAMNSSFSLPAFDYGSGLFQIKQKITNSRLLILFQAGFLFIGNKKESTKSNLQALVEYIADKLYQNAHCLEIKRFHIPSTGTKAIVLLEKRSCGTLLILRLPMTPKEGKLSVHYDVLKTLHAIQAPVHVPTVLISGIWRGISFGVETKIDGYSVVTKVPGLLRICQNAAHELLQIARKTKKVISVEQECLDDLFFRRINTFTRFFPDEEASFKVFKAHVAKRFLHTQVPLVLEHGDFKIENMIVLPESLKVNGIIDWDYFVQEGLPFIDLFRLVSSFYQVRDSLSSDAVFSQRIIGLHFEKNIWKIFESFMDELELDRESAQVLGFIYWFHLKCRANTPQSLSNDDRSKWQQIYHQVNSVVQPMT